ncbi:MAG TPA: glycosyltransferase family 4 protein [Prolixibacteraceae bacterium]|nr:glycosyltransferase family 4 protein [Prolixibacteraceae bacterium]
MKKILLAVTNDLITDYRIHRTATTLQSMGFDVMLVGSIFRDKAELKRPYRIHRLDMFFRNGRLFYFEFNIRLILFAIKGGFDVFVANGLGVLPGIGLSAFLKRKPFAYDCYDLSTESAEMIGKPFGRWVWKVIERSLIRKARRVYTISESIAIFLEAKYKIHVDLVRNTPEFQAIKNYPPEYRLVHEGLKVLIYQGAVNKGRGLEMIINAMKYLPEAMFFIVGEGAEEKELEKLVLKTSLYNRVIFYGRVPFEELKFLTMQADLGLSAEEDICLNYRYSLPNKLFDYIHAGIPVLVSGMPEMEKIVTERQIGKIILDRSPEKLAAKIRAMLSDDESVKMWRENAITTAREYNWSNEKKKVIEIYQEFL